MFASHPYLSAQLADERSARLRADAGANRRARPLRASWQPARFVEPTTDLCRVVPAHAPEPANPGQAA
jgi:hypothetical protein